MQDLYKVNDKIILKNIKQFLKNIEDHAMILVGRHENSEINVSFKFYFSETITHLPEVKGRLIRKLLKSIFSFNFVKMGKSMGFFSW